MKMSTACKFWIATGLFWTLVGSGSPVEGGGPPFQIPTSERFKVGKETLETYKTHAQQSPCWKNAVSKIETSCKDLRDIEQSFLAIAFTNCHLEKSGRATYPCERSKGTTVKECTKDMDDSTFSTYTTFFTHTSNMCFFLSSQAWQERTENTITELSRTSEDVANQLEESVEKQRLVLKHQNLSLENQKKIIQSEMHLTETLQTSTSRAKAAFEDMHQSANEQRALFSETFDGIFKRVESIRQLQSMLLGEFISLQSLAFHVVAVCVCYFFTSAPRTAGARLALFFGLTGLIAVERLVTSWSIGDDGTTESTELLHAWLWFCRKVFIMMAVMLLLIVGYQYQDYSRVNFDMLREIQKQIRDMKSVHTVQDKNPICAAITNGGIDEERPSTVYQREAAYSLGGHDMVDWSARDTDESDNSYSPSEEESGTDNDEDTESGERRKTPQITPRTSQSPSRHHYNLRPRSTPSSPLNRSSIRNMPSPRTFSELIKNLKQSASRQYTAVSRKDGENRDAPLFSSDEES